MNITKKIPKNFMKLLCENEAYNFLLKQNSDKIFYECRQKILSLLFEEIEKLEKGEKVNLSKINILSTLSKISRE